MGCRVCRLLLDLIQGMAGKVKVRGQRLEWELDITICH